MQAPLIAIFAGSFDPIHIGHMALANYLFYQIEGLTQLWFLPTAQNPIKGKAELSFGKRCNLIDKVIEGDSRFSCCRIEGSLPSPHYTIHTLDALQADYPRYRFGLIIGADNWVQRIKWYHWEELVAKYPLWVYPRPEYPIGNTDMEPNVHLLSDAPLLEVSSTAIRQAREKGQDFRYWLPRPDLFDLL